MALWRRKLQTGGRQLSEAGYKGVSYRLGEDEFLEMHQAGVESASFEHLSPVHVEAVGRRLEEDVKVDSG